MKNFTTQLDPISSVKISKITLNRYFTPEHIWMSDKHMIICSTHIFSRKIQWNNSSSRMITILTGFFIFIFNLIPKLTYTVLPENTKMPKRTVISISSMISFSENLCNHYYIFHLYYFIFKRLLNRYILD